MDFINEILLYLMIQWHSNIQLTCKLKRLLKTFSLSGDQKFRASQETYKLFTVQPVLTWTWIEGYSVFSGKPSRPRGSLTKIQVSTLKGICLQHNKIRPPVIPL